MLQAPQAAEPLDPGEAAAAGVQRLRLRAPGDVQEAAGKGTRRQPGTAAASPRPSGPAAPPQGAPLTSGRRPRRGRAARGRPAPPPSRLRASNFPPLLTAPLRQPCRKAPPRLSPWARRIARKGLVERGEGSSEHAHCGR